MARGSTWSVERACRYVGINYTTYKLYNCTDSCQVMDLVWVKISGIEVINNSPVSLL